MFATKAPAPRSSTTRAPRAKGPPRKPVWPPWAHSPVQLLRSPSREQPAGASPDVRAAAARGIAGPGGRLPYFDTIQRAFGGHDLSSVVAHVDRRANAACTEIGATAFATGDHVAFRAAPSLHTAAHEAAHVVQQRAGVYLRGGVGEAGDGYERDADRVAAIVARGESAAAVPGRGATGATMPRPTSGATSTVQRQEGEARPPESPPGRPQVAGESGDAVYDAPAATYIIPFDRKPLAAPGERIIFNSLFTDPKPADYRLEYSTSGGNFGKADGPANQAIEGLKSGNVDLFVPAMWDGKSTLQVVLNVRKISDKSIVQTETWDFGLKVNYPTTMKQQEGTGETSLPAKYTYDIGPPLLVALPPYYQHQTILEKFGNWSLGNIEPKDIEETYRNTNALTSAAAVSSHFLGNYSGNNGTFTVSAKDQIRDKHDGYPNLSKLVSRLAAPKDIEVALPQTYEAKPGTALGKYTVTRILKADGVTWKAKKG